MPLKFSREYSKTRDQPTKILEPCKQPLDLPSVTIATQGAAILRQVRTVAAMRRDTCPEESLTTY